MNKKLIRLTESDLHRIVKESVKRILKETKSKYDDPNYSYWDDDDVIDSGELDVFKGGKWYQRIGPNSLKEIDPNIVRAFDINSGIVKEMSKDEARKYAEEMYNDFGRDYEFANPNEYEDIRDWFGDWKDSLKQIYYDYKSEDEISRYAEIERYGILDSYLDTFAD